MTLFTGIKNISTSVLGGQMVQRPKTLSGLDADYRSVGQLAKRMSKFATANCPYQYQTQPRTSVQLTVNTACSPVVENYVVAAWASSVRMSTTGFSTVLSDAGRCRLFQLVFSAASLLHWRGFRTAVGALFTVSVPSCDL